MSEVPDTTDTQQPVTQVIGENGTKRVTRHMDAEGIVSFRCYENDEEVIRYMSRGDALFWLNG